MTINPFYNSAIPTEVGTFSPWVNPSGPAPALGQGLLQPFPSVGDRHHLAELLHLLRGGDFLLWLLLGAQQVCFGAIWGCGSSDCSIFQVHNRAGRGDRETHPTRTSQSLISSDVSSHCMGVLIVIIYIYLIPSHLLGYMCLLQ